MHWKKYFCLSQKRNLLIANFTFETKAQLIDIKIGYPDFTYNDTYIDSLYEDVRIMKKFINCKIMLYGKLKNYVI